MLVGEGVDLLVLETFYSLVEIEQALAAARSAFAGPIVAQVAFSEDRRAVDGLTPAGVAERLRRWGADVVGANCAEGPAFHFEIAREMLAAGAPVGSSLTPAVAPSRRAHHLTTTPGASASTPRSSFQSGVRLVGGCCGFGSGPSARWGRRPHAARRTGHRRP